MARKVANGVNKKQRRSGTNFGTSTALDSSERNFSMEDRSSGGRTHVIREWISNPAVKYVAGGIATAILSRLAQNMSEKYPELSRFLKENIDSFEGRLGQYRSGGFENGQDRESRA